MEESRSNNRIYLLEIIRGLSCIAIILYHYTTRYGNSIGHINEWPFQVQYGYCAVQIFFILSGFLTVYTYREQNTFAYLKKRLVRLYPVFWVSIIITTLYWLVILPGRVCSIKDILLNFTMMPTLFNAECVDGAYWTLAKELIFYFTIALLIFSKQIKRLWIIQLPWIVAVFAATVYYKSPDMPLKNVVSVLFNVEYAHYFIIGIAIYYFVFGNKKIQKIISAITAILCLIYDYWVEIKVDFFFFVGFFVLLFVVIFLHKNGYQMSDTVKKILSPISYISKISYPLYLVHQMTGFALMYQLDKVGLRSEWFIFIPIFNAIILATAMHYGVEKPVLSLCSAIGRGKKISKEKAN